MKRIPAVLAALCLAITLRAQPPATAYTPEQLDQLLAPIALYPDPLIALILPASTDPTDLSAAAQYLAAGGNPGGIDAQPWDPSVKGLAHYPTVVKWMTDNLDWTRSLGAVFAMQPSDVMQSIQQLRVKARAAGTLTDTAQQQVQMQGDDIRIIPTQQDTVYVPEYDPDVVYDVPAGDAGPYLSFGLGYPVGPWLGFECNWDDFGIWAGPWRRGWDYRRDWRGGDRWHPDAARGHALVRGYYRPGGNLPSPRAFAGGRGPEVRGPERGAMGPARGPNPAPRVQARAPEPRPTLRGYSGGGERPSAAPSRTSIFGGQGRGTQVRAYSSRGQSSRRAPVRQASPGRSAPSGGKRH